MGSVTDAAGVRDVVSPPKRNEPCHDATFMSVSDFFASIVRLFRSAHVRADHKGLERVRELLDTTKPKQPEVSDSDGDEESGRE